MNQDIGPLCQDTTVSLTHDGLTYYVSYYSVQSSTPSSFQLITSVAAPGPDGYTNVLSLNFSHTPHDDSMDSSHMTSIHGDFNYSLTGSVGVNGNRV